MNKPRAAAKAARFTPMMRNMSITSVRQIWMRMRCPHFCGLGFSCPFYQPGDEYRVVRKQM